MRRRLGWRIGIWAACLAAVPAVVMISAAASETPSADAATVATALVTYPATVRTDGGTVNERTGPSTANAAAGQLPNGRRVGVACQVYGQLVRGRVTTTAYWDVLSNGRYVADGYLSFAPRRPAVAWCGARGHEPVRATVRTDGGRLLVRSGASRAHRSVGSLPNGAVLNVACQVWGETIAGTVIRSAAWDRLPGGRYVSDSFVRWAPERPALPWCGEAPLTLAPPTTSAFIRQSVASAQASQRTYRVPAAVTLAQAVLESGAGRSALTRVDHNYFGMKCSGGPGPIAIGCRTYATHECTRTSCFATTASFRAYRTAADSYADHGRLLATATRYRPAFKYVNDPDKFARALQAAGYATSPTYAADLIALMRKYDLYRYDLQL